MAIVALPNCSRDGALPSSIQVRVAGWPAVSVEEATGEVSYFGGGVSVNTNVNCFRQRTKTFASAEAARAREMMTGLNMLRERE